MVYENSRPKTQKPNFTPPSQNCINMVHVVVYMIDGIRSCAVFRKLEDAQEFCIYARGKIYSETIDRMKH